MLLCNENLEKSRSRYPNFRHTEFQGRTDRERDKENCYILVKRKIQQEELTVINIYTPNSVAPNLIKQTLMHMKNQINMSMIVMGDLSTPPSQIDILTRQKKSRNIRVEPLPLSQAKGLSLIPVPKKER